MKHIVITGGAGFIGSHLCGRLLQQGHVVICVDNLSTSTVDNIKVYLDNPNFTFIEHDIVSPLFLDQKIDEIYNLACPASPVHYQYNPIHTIKANTIGVINMLGLAKKHQATFFQASTSEVYGDPLVHPQTEEYRGNVSTIGPRACYDEGKRCAETLCFDYHRAHGVPIKVVRIFNTYGPHMAVNDGRVVSNFIIQALRGEDITIYGNGEQTRSFCYVDDLVNGFMSMMSQDSFITGPINLGNPHEFTMLELAQLVIALTNSSSKLVFHPLPVDDPKQRKPDIRLAQQVLLWEPKVDLETGLQKTIAYFSRLI